MSLMRQSNQPGAIAHLLALLILLASTGLTMSIGLGGRDSTHTMENVAVACAQETWLRWHDGDALSLYVTSNSEIRRIRKPPMLVWLDMAVWADQVPERAEPSTLLLRARMVTLFLALLMVASIYWSANTLRGFRFAILSGLIAATTLLLQRQGRTASYDIHMAAWTALAAAGLLHAIRPGRTDQTRVRTWLGWSACFVGLLFASYSKNPLPVALNVIPGMGAILLHHRHRFVNTARLALVSGLALAGVGIWYWWVFRTFPETAAALQHEVTQPRGDDAQPFYYYLGLIGLVAPWCAWLVSGVVHPFTSLRRDVVGDPESARIHHVARWLPLLWFGAIFLLFSIPEAKQQRYILPIIPAAALLMASVWFDHERMSRRGQKDRAIMPFAYAHWGGLCVASVAITLLLGWPEWTADMLMRITGEEEPPVYAGAGIVPAVLVGLVLLLLALTGLVVHRQWKPFRAGIICGIWSMMALGANWFGYSGAESGIHPLRAPTEELRVELADAPIYELRTPDMEERLGLINEEFRFYLGRLIKRLPMSEIEDEVAGGDVFYLLVRPDRVSADELTALGLSPIREVRTDKRRKMMLWSSAGQEPPSL